MRSAVREGELGSELADTGDGGSAESMKWAWHYAREAAEAYGGTEDEWMRRGRRAALDMDR